MSTIYKIFFAFLVLAVSGAANAALVTTNGNTVSFTYDDLLVGLFGSPTVSGDSLFFVPTNFNALRENVAGGALTSSTFSVKIDALQGNVIGSIALTERGDYLLEGDHAKATVTGELRAVDLADPFSTYASNISPTGAFSQTDFDGPTGKWTADAYLDLPYVASAIVSIENILRAKISIGNAGDELAFIQKKFVGLSANALPFDDIPVTVPLPQAIWLFGAGLFGLLSISKRKKYI